MKPQQYVPKFENIVGAVKFETTSAGVGSSSTYFGRSRLVASLNVGASVWYSDAEAQRHPEMLAHLKDKLRLFLLRQLYHDQRAEMAELIEKVFMTWHPIGDIKESFDARDKLLELAKYSPPAGFDDDNFDCDRGENCGCEQFEFLLQPSPK
jgi:hypothetical protein